MPCLSSTLCMCVCRSLGNEFSGFTIITAGAYELTVEMISGFVS